MISKFVWLLFDWPTLVLGVLVVVATQIYFRKCHWNASPDKTAEGVLFEKDEKEKLEKIEETLEENSEKLLKDFTPDAVELPPIEPKKKDKFPGYNKEDLNEIKKAAFILHTLNPPNPNSPEERTPACPFEAMLFKRKREQEEEKKLVRSLEHPKEAGDQIKDKMLLARLKEQRSQLGGTLEKPQTSKDLQDQKEDVDLGELEPENITVAHDEDVSSEISTQALADIEAEMLDSSLLLTEETQAEETKCSNEDLLNKEAVNVVENSMMFALTEMAMESLVSYDYNEDTDQGDSDSDADMLGCGEIRSTEDLGAGEMIRLRGKKGPDVDEICRDILESVIKDAFKVDEDHNRDIEDLSTDLIRRSVMKAILQLDAYEPRDIQSYKEVASSMTDQEMEKEQRIQERQLDKIFLIMKEHPEMFGTMTSDDLANQAGMYCM